MEAEVEADANSENLESSNGRSDSNNKSYYVVTKVLKHPSKKTKHNDREQCRIDGENPNETRESQQQKCGNTIPIAKNRRQYQSQNQKSSLSTRNND